MTTELNEQEIQRRQNMQAMKDMGINPYPAAEYPTNAFSTDIVAEFSDEATELRQVCIAGRMMSRRIMGKASFIELKDSKGRVQVYVTRDDICPEENKDMYNVVFKKLLDLGDFIGVKGFVFRTQTGQISIHAQELTVLPAPPAKKVKVKLFKDNGQYSEPIFVSVNGERYIVPRGVEVEIPEYIAEVLERSMAEDQQTALMLEQLEQKFNEKTKEM